ncbi:MAG: hypothetical protein ACXWT3_06545 [Methylococcaceae bacterium]
MLKILGLVSVLALTLANTATAGEAYSWDLSRAMMQDIVNNPKGVWAFMQNTSGVDDPSNYTLLPTYQSACGGAETLHCWRDTKISIHQAPPIGVATKTFESRLTTHRKWRPLLHPGENVPVILRWTSPIDGNVSVMGTVSDIDYISGAGDGVNWSLKDTNATVIKSGTLANGEGDTFAAQNVLMHKGESLYFSIDMKDDINSDSTNLEMLIISQQ